MAAADLLTSSVAIVEPGSARHSLELESVLLRELLTLQCVHVHTHTDSRHSNCKVTSQVYGTSSSQSNLPHRDGSSHTIHRITRCYPPPGRGDIPAVTPAEAGTRLSDPGGTQG